MIQKILMVAPEPIFEPRGTPFSVVGRLKALSDMGIGVDLVTYPMGENVCLPGVRFIRIPAVPGIRKIKIGPSFQKIPLDFLLMICTLRQLFLGSYDLIHTHEEAGFWGTLFSRWFGVPHIYDMHSSLPQQLRNFEFTQSGTVRRIFESMESWVLKYASAVITICPDLEQHVARLFPERGSVLIENVVDYGTVFGEQDRSAEIKNALKLKGKKVALYTGTLEPYQGLDLLIESAVHVIRKNPNVVFLIVGGHREQVGLYRRKAEQAGVNNHVIFTGQVKPQEINSYIGCADVLVTPRISGTNTPLKIYAYLRSGVPIVATRILTHTQVLDASVACLAEADPHAFAEGVNRVLDDSAYRNALVKKAAALADAEYSYTVYLSRFRHAMNMALERGI
ncbi:glycosyltransferase [bacterium]|nr:glycosyltransferase [bacterium]